MKKFLSFLGVVFSVSVAFSQCAQILDQQQTSFNTGTSGTEHWQSFTPAINGKLTQVNFYLNGIQTLTITLEVRAGNGTGGALLYTNNYSYSGVNNEQVMVIPFASAPVLAAASQYTIRFTSASSIGTLAHSSNLYGGGQYYSSNFGFTYPDTWFKTFMTPTNVPSISITGQSNPTCFGFANGSITTTPSGGNGGNTYLWTPSGITTQNASGLAANSYTVVVTDMYGCTGSANATLVNPAQVTMTDPADQVVCAGSLTSAVVFTGAGSYTWTNSNPSIGLAASGSGNIGAFTAVNAGVTPQVATITVTPSAGGCTGVIQTFTITVNPMPTVTNPGNQAQCNGFNTGAVNFTGTVGGTVFNWTNSLPSIGLAATGSGNIAPFTATNAGVSMVTANLTVTPSAGGCTGAPQNFSISVYPTPTVNDPPDQVVCNGSSTAAIVFTGSVGGTTYNWTNSNPAIGLGVSGAGNITAFTATNGGTTPVSATITVTPLAGGCPGPVQTINITVNPTPTVAAPANQTLCAGNATAPVNFTGTVVGTTYTWTNSNPSIGLAASGAGNIAAFTSTNAGVSPITGNIVVTPAANGCVGPTSSFSYTVNPIPTVVDPPDQTHCTGILTTAVNWTGSVGGTLYNWTNSNTTIGLGASGFGNIPSFTANNPGFTPIVGTVIVTPTAGGCNGPTQSFSYTINPSPNAFYATAFPSLCDNEPVYAFNEGSPLGAGGVYSGAGVSANSIDPAAAGPGVHSITYTFTDGNGCIDFVSQNITIYASPVVTFSAVPDFCEDAATYALFEGSPAGGVYAGPSISAGVFDPATAGPGGFAATYTYTDVNGCSEVANQTITVNALPAVTFAAVPVFCANDAPYTLVEGAPVGGTYSGPGIAGGIFDPATAGTGVHVVNYTYTDGNGCTDDTDQNITVNGVPAVSFSSLPDICENAASYALTEGLPAGGIYSGPGISGTDFDPTSTGLGAQALTYTYTDVNGCTDFANQSINVIAIPTVTASADLTICSGDNANISVTGSASGYNWDNGLGAGSGHTVSPALTTTYLVTGTGINGCSATDDVVVNVNSLPVVNFPAPADVCITAAPFALSGATPAGGIYSGPGVSAGTFDPAVAGNGSHLLTYSYTDGVTGCTDFATSPILVYAAPSVTANATATNVCEGDAVTLTGGGAVSYAWDNGVTDGVAFIPAVGTITYGVIGTDGNGCQNIDLIAVTVHPLPVVTAGADLTLCEGSPLTLTGGGASTYAWTNGAINNVSFTPPLGTTIYTVTGTDGNGCQSTDDITITVNPLPVLSVSPDDVFCAGETLTLTAGGAITFDWDSGASTASSYTITPSSTTTVQVTGTSMGCSATSTITLTLDDPSLVDAGPGVTICAGFTTYLVASGGVSYEWNGPNADNVTDGTYGFQVDTTAWYYLTATTADGCVYTDSVLVTSSTDPACTIEPLTTFSPNGDAVNETWKIQGINAFPMNSVTIINRWGDVVFEEENYDNDNVMWSGTLPNGNEAPEGTYFYVIEIADGPSTTGWIQLMK